MKSLTRNSNDVFKMDITTKIFLDINTKKLNLYYLFNGLLFSGHTVTFCRHTLWVVDVNEIRLRSEHDLLKDDSEAVDVSSLSSVDRSSCHAQQLRCSPQLIAVIS